MSLNLRSRQIRVSPFSRNGGIWVNNERMFTPFELNTFLCEHRYDANLHLRLRLNNYTPSTDIFSPLSLMTSNLASLEIVNCDFSNYPAGCLESVRCSDLCFTECVFGDAISNLLANAFEKLSLFSVTFGTNASACVAALNSNTSIIKINIIDVIISAPLHLSLKAEYIYALLDGNESKYLTLTTKSLEIEINEGLDFVDIDPTLHQLWLQIDMIQLVKLKLTVSSSHNNLQLPIEAINLKSLHLEIANRESEDDEDDLDCHIVVPRYQSLIRLDIWGFELDSLQVNYWKQRLDEDFFYNPDFSNIDSMKIIKEICNETEDNITMENFSKAPNKIVTIIANSVSNTGYSIAHCYNLDSLLKYWEIIDATERFELVGLRIFVDNDGVENLKQFKTQILIKIPNSDLYTLKPTNRKSLLLHMHDFKQTQFDPPEPFAPNSDDVVYHET